LFALKSAGKPSTDPTKSPISSKALEGFDCLDSGALCNRSRTILETGILHKRDSCSISAMSSSGKRTVSIFMEKAYYNDGMNAIRNYRCIFQPARIIITSEDTRDIYQEFLTRPAKAGETPAAALLMNAVIEFTMMVERDNPNSVCWNDRVLIMTSWFRSISLKFRN
jgi:hypothetical protein